MQFNARHKLGKDKKIKIFTTQLKASLHLEMSALILST